MKVGVSKGHRDGIPSAWYWLMGLLVGLVLVVPCCEANFPLGGLNCITCTDGCDMPREPASNTLTEVCSEAKEQVAVCVSYFDPVKPNYNLGRGCMRRKDLPSNFREGECMMVDVSDFWEYNGSKKRTCVCFCTFDACNYEPLCYGHYPPAAAIKKPAKSAAPRRPQWTPASMIFAIVVFTIVMAT